MENENVSEKNWPHTASATAKRFSSIVIILVSILQKQNARKRCDYHFISTLQVTVLLSRRELARLH